MAKDNKQNIETETISTEIVVKTTKSIKDKVIDFSGGKVQLFVDGYENGETVAAEINGKQYEAEVFDGMAIVCTGHSFKNYPSINF